MIENLYRLAHWDGTNAFRKTFYGDWKTYIPSVKDAYDPATMKHKGQPLQSVHHYKLKDGQ